MSNNADLEIGLLGFIKDFPSHGYEIHKRISDLSGVGIIWKVKMGNLYQMLNKLEEDGLIETREILQDNRPPKKELHITQSGLNAFETWIQAPIQHGRDFRIAFLLKLYFAMQQGQDISSNLVQRQIETCKMWTEKRNALKTEGAPAFTQVVQNYRLSQIEHYIDWLSWCKDFLRRNVQ